MVKGRNIRLIHFGGNVMRKIVSQCVTGALVGCGLASCMVAVAPSASATVLGCPTSNVCVYQHARRGGSSQVINGYNGYTDLAPALHDRASSWTNANLRASEGIGEWRRGRQFIGQVLPPGWYEDNLKSVNFNDVADFVKQV